MNFKFLLTKAFSLILLLSVLLAIEHLHAADLADAGMGPNQGETVPVAIIFDVKKVNNPNSDPALHDVDIDLDFILRLHKDNIIIVEWGDGSPHTTVHGKAPNNIPFTHTYTTCTSGTCDYTVTLRTCASDISYLSMTDEGVQTFDISTNGLPGIEHLGLTSNNIGGTLDLTASKPLETLKISGNPITALNITNLTNLKTIFGNCEIPGVFDFSTCPALEDLRMPGNLFTNAIFDNPNLTNLEFHSNPLNGTIDLTNCPKLKTCGIGISHHGGGMAVNVDGLTELESLDLYESQVNANLDLSTCTNLRMIRISKGGGPPYTPISVDLSGLENLEIVVIGHYIEGSVDISQSLDLQRIQLGPKVDELILPTAGNVVLSSLYIVSIDGTSLPSSEIDAFRLLIPTNPHPGPQYPLIGYGGFKDHLIFTNTTFSPTATAHLNFLGTQGWTVSY